MESPLCDAADDPELRLIETAFWDGAVCHRQALHLARLAQGADTLGWTLDVDRARDGLRGVAGTPARLRLTLARDGTIEVQRAPPPAPIALWRLGPAVTRLRAGDPWLRVKSTRRAAYDDARRAMPAGLDEVVLLNDRQQVCDGSITTIFFDRGQGLRTPPLDCGLLPGILRADLLAQGICREEVLNADELGHVRLWVGNALRGLGPAVWHDGQGDATD